MEVFRKKGKHLTWNDRLTIERMLLKGYGKRQIADVIGCCLATVYNEIKRATYVHTNSDLTEEVRYNPDEAQRKYEYYLSLKGRTAKLREDPELAKYIEKLIREKKFSPGAALLYIRKNGIEFETEIRSVNTVYFGIKKGLLGDITFKDLPYRRKRSKRKVVVRKAARAAKGTSIEKRAGNILERKDFGNWEMDCVIGKPNNKKTILVLTERKTRFEIAEVMKAHNSYEVVKALNRIEKRYGSDFFKIFKTITVDNGSEFQDYEGMEKALYRKGSRTKVYYCHPYAPHERGSNENCNRLIRRFLPKGMDFDKKLDKCHLQKVAAWINSYPRQLFDGDSSAERFRKELQLLGLAA